MSIQEKLRYRNKYGINETTVLFKYYHYQSYIIVRDLFNPLQPGVSFLYPLKTSGFLMFSGDINWSPTSKQEKFILYNFLNK